MKSFIFFVIGLIVGFYTYALIDSEPLLGFQGDGDDSVVDKDINNPAANKWWDEVVFDGKRFIPDNIVINQNRLLGVQNQSNTVFMELASDGSIIPSHKRAGHMEYVTTQLTQEGEFKIWVKDVPSAVLTVTVQLPQPSVAN